MVLFSYEPRGSDELLSYKDARCFLPSQILQTQALCCSSFLNTITFQSSQIVPFIYSIPITKHLMSFPVSCKSMWSALGSLRKGAQQRPVKGYSVPSSSATLGYPGPGKALLCRCTIAAGCLLRLGSLSISRIQSKEAETNSKLCFNLREKKYI